MVQRVQSYETDEILVTYDPNLCTHAAECVRGLPAVFDTRRPDWIRPGAAPAERVAEVIRRCPSGALQYRMKGASADGPAAAPSAPEGTERATIAVKLLKDGPLLFDGLVRVAAEDGSVIERSGKVALCRCGGTGNQPFCDGSHKRVGFRSAR
jgi:uncharacterized Fe-S cluster protein YjdI